jgi:tetratricopeptide (TPR) repeat protein
MGIRRASCLFLAVVALFVSLFFQMNPGFAQDKASGDYGSGMEKSPQAKEADKKALDKLRAMSPEEVEALDKSLAEALVLYYDKNYGRALPIFRGISEKVETMDILFWYATCAHKAGETDLAVRKYRQMLAIDPNLHRVRLELATVYFSTGQYNEARRELKSVLAARPPEAVEKNIQKLLSAIDDKTRRLFTNLRVSQAIQWDSNVSAGPDRETVGVPGGGLITLTRTQQEIDDWVTVTSLYGNLLYDLGERRGLMWNTTGSFYQTHNFDHHQFDYTNGRVTTGPWWTGDRFVFKLPAGFSRNYYEHETLFDAFDVSPSIEYYFTRNFTLMGRFTYLDESYDPEDRRGEDSVNRIYEINPNFYFNNGNDAISLSVYLEDLNAKARRYTYDALNAAVSYYKRLPWDMEFYVRYRYVKREYEAPVPLFTAIGDREEKRHYVYLALSRNFARHLFATLYLDWIDNNSNVDLYDFDKTVCGLALGARF